MKVTLYPKYFFRSLFVHGRHDFFKEGYKLLYPEYSRHGMTPWQHYVIFGKRQGLSDGRSPSGYAFFPEGYAIEYPDVIAAGEDPWRHYAEKGRAEGRDNGLHPKKDQFFPEGYLAMYPDVAARGWNPWRHYVLHGKKEGRDNGLHPKKDQFFPEGYLAMYPDVAKARMDPWRHYVLYGKKAGRDNGFHPSGKVFFAAGYLAMYPDVAESGMDPWHHYVLIGKKEGRDNGLHPAEDIFDAGGYVRMYPDVARAGVDPWHHYVLHGKKERRLNGYDPAFSPYFYNSYYPDVRKSKAEPWKHYIKSMAKVKRFPNKLVEKEKRSEAIPYFCNNLSQNLNQKFYDYLGKFDSHALFEILSLRESPDSKEKGFLQQNSDNGGRESLKLFVKDDLKKIVYFSHRAGGGATIYKDQKIKEYTDLGYMVLTVIYDPAARIFLLYIDTKQYSYYFDNVDLRLLLKLNLANVETIFVNSLNKYPKETDYFFSVIDLITDFKKSAKAKLVFLGHDYDFVCPRITCLNADNEFCELSQSHFDCSICASQRTVLNITQYRNMYARLLRECDEYRFFSDDTIQNFLKVYSLDKTRIKLVPHNLSQGWISSAHWTYDPKTLFAKFTILVLGNIEKHKGSGFVKNLADVLNRTHPDIRVVILGAYQEKNITPNITVTGAYDTERLPELIRMFEPNCAFFPSVWPETFSFTVHELMQFGLPIISFDIGAQAEALRSYKRGIIVPEMSVECLHDAVSRLYDESYPYRITNRLEQYSVTMEELRFFNRKECSAASSDAGTRIIVCINVASEKDDYASIVDYVRNLEAGADSGKSHSKGGTGSDGLRLCFLVNDKLATGFRKSAPVQQLAARDYEVIPTNGSGAFKLLHDHAVEGNVLYIEAFDRTVSELEKYYILTSIFGRSLSQTEDIISLISDGRAFVYLDDFYTHSTKVLDARMKQNEKYLHARRIYLTHGCYELYLDHSKSAICSYRNVFAFNTKVLSDVSRLILDQGFFVDCPDSVIFDLALNDLTIRQSYEYIKLVPEKVGREHLSSQRELFRQLALANFNPDFYREKYSDLAKVQDLNAHFSQHGFEENRLYADFISDEWLEEHCGNADLEEKYYLKSYKSYAEANFIYGMSLADYRKYVGVPCHYADNPADYYNSAVDFSQIKVSFIVPVYNSARFLRQCLDSIYNVDYPDFEVILVDDGSNDNSVDIINEYKERYSSRTKVIIHPENMCFAATHKDGINAADGKYFTIIDADDYIAREYAKVFVIFAETYHLDMAVCDWTRPKKVTAFYSDNEYLIDPVVATAGELQDSFGNWNNPLIPNIHYGLNRKLYNRETFIRANPITIDPDYAYNEDFSVTLKLSACIDLRIGMIKNRLYGWFDNPDSVSYCEMTQKAIVHFVYTFFEDLKEFIKNDKFSVRLISCFQKHLYDKLERIENNRLLKTRLEFLAGLLDQHIDLINSLPYSLKNYVKGMFNRLYSRAIKSMHCKYEKVCILDTIGHHELKDFLLPKLKEEKIDFYYSICSPDDTFAGLMEKLRQVNDCSLIVTDGGWSWSEMVTDLPIINTWHGMGALKYVSQFPPHLQPEVGFSSGTDVNFCYRWMYNLPDSKIITNGNLVASRYLHADFREKCRNQFFAGHPELKGKRIYLYTPTFRGYEPNYSIMEPGYDWNRVSELLQEDEVILVKWHPCLKSFSADVLPDLSKYSNIIDVTDADLSEVLMSASVLLTDYSSCIFYAALIDLPIGILATDLDSYSSNRGFFIDYRKEAPCEVFEETDEARLLDYIRSRRSDTTAYKEFKKRHVGGVTDNVDEILARLIRNYLNGSLSLY